jgi:hypothetical protein
MPKGIDTNCININLLVVGGRGVRGGYVGSVLQM